MIHLAVLAGGKGERFWPLSRADRPKQLLHLCGAKPLLRETLDRIHPLGAVERTMIVTSAHLRDRVEREAPELPPENILAEPRGRNTAAACALASAVAFARDPDAVVLTVPSDAWVPDPSPFRMAAEEALELARGSECLVCVTVAPTRPETGYGYLELGDPVGPGVPHARRVVRFVEKPPAEEAARLAASGRHVWNAGAFAWKARRFLEEVDRTLPDLAGPLAVFRKALGDGRRVDERALLELYRAAPSISVDYGVMERSSCVAAVVADFCWDDLGSYLALARMAGTPGGGVTTAGDVYAKDSTDSILYSEDGLLAAIGVEGLIVVHTEDVTFVCPKERLPEIRTLLDSLGKERRFARYL
jgi:mannose-1-phosphate guanylyltransferase